MIPIIAAVTGTMVGFGLNIIFNFWWKHRDERRLRQLELYRDQIPHVLDLLQSYVNTNIEHDWLAISKTEEVERGLLELYSTAAITGAREAAKCTIFRELADELQRMRMSSEYEQDHPRFLRDGGRARRNYEYAAQAVLAAEDFRAWLGRRLARRIWWAVSTRLEYIELQYIEIDREKAGEDLSRFDQPDRINRQALVGLLGNRLLDCRVLDGCPLPGTTFDLKLARDCISDLTTAGWADVVAVGSLPDNSIVARLYTPEKTDLPDEYPVVAFHSANPPYSDDAAEWSSPHPPAA